MSIIPTSVVDEVRAIINKFKPNNKNESLEVEIKFGMVDGGFRNGVQKKTFYRLIEDLKDMEVYPRIENTIDELETTSSKVRIRKSTATSTGKVSWLKKERIFDYDSLDYSYRLSISKETRIPQPSSFRGSYSRNKKRRVYNFINDSFELDITEVDSGNRKITFEVEFELKDNTVDLNTTITKAFKIVNDSFDIYTNDEKRKVISYINQSLESSRGGNDYFDIANLALPRNIKFKDLVYGGIVGHPDISYNVTNKSDGTRKQVLIHETGIWIFSITNEYNKISHESLVNYFTDETNLYGMQGYILDGELIPKNKRLEGASGAKYWFLIFDCLAVPSNTKVNSATRNIQDEPFLTRIENSQLIADVVKNPIIEISTKTFYGFDTPTEFFSRINVMFEDQSKLPYVQDGLIFTPVEVGYNLKFPQDLTPGRDRVLTKFPEITKWKPKEKLTIDLEISWNRNRLTLLMSSKRNSNDGKIEFIGDKINKFDSSRDVDLSQKLANTSSGMIGEFSWDYDRRLLVLERIRADKAKANNDNIVLDVWEDIHNPIEEEVLRGNSMKLLRRYHNKVKTSLYNFVTPPDSNLTLLDIGSGKGGDTAKWRNFSKVVAVEPNIDNFKELQNRIEVFGLQDKVYAINTKGEDTKKITQAVKSFIGTRVDVVSMMLSLSYFWENKSSYTKLFDTIITNISPNGKFIFLTVDGNIVQNIFEPQLNNSVSLDEIRSGDYFYMKYNSDTSPISVDVYMKDSILNNREWLVKIDDLSLSFSEYGFRNTFAYRTDKELLLSQVEKVFGNMFTYGVFEPSAEAKITVFSTKTNIKSDRKLPIPINLYDRVTLPNIPEVNVVTVGAILEPTVIIDLRKGEEKKVLKKDAGNIKIVQNRLPVQKEMNSLDGKSFDGISFSKLKPLSVPKSFNLLVTPSKKQLVSNKIVSIPENNKNFELVSIIEIQYFPFEDDFMEYIKDNIVRVSSIDDNSSFFHCLLKAVSDDYKNSMDLPKRKQMAAELRRDLAFVLNENVPGRDQTYYEMLRNGLFATLFAKYNEYSLEFLQMKLNSSEVLSEEFLFIVSEIVQIDFIICEVLQSKLRNDTTVIIKFVTSTLISEIHNKPIVILSMNKNHYELISLVVNDIFNYCFMYNDSIVQNILLGSS